MNALRRFFARGQSPEEPKPIWPRPGLDLTRNPMLPQSLQTRPRMLSHKVRATQTPEIPLDPAYDISQPQFFRGKLASEPGRPVEPEATPFNWKEEKRKEGKYTMDSAPHMVGQKFIKEHCDDDEFIREYTFKPLEEMPPPFHPTFEWMEIYAYKFNFPLHGSVSVGPIWNHWASMKYQLEKDYKKELYTMRTVLTLETRNKDIEMVVWAQIARNGAKLAYFRRKQEEMFADEQYWRAQSKYRDQGDMIGNHYVREHSKLNQRIQDLEARHQELLDEWHQLTPEALEKAFQNADWRLKDLYTALRYREGWFYQDDEKYQQASPAQRKVMWEIRKNALNMIKYGEPRSNPAPSNL